jgi:hypothetical protein
VDAAITNAISVAERILSKIDGRWPAKQQDSQIQPMLDSKMLQSVARQLMTRRTVKVRGKTLRVGRTSAHQREFPQAYIPRCLSVYATRSIASI